MTWLRERTRSRPIETPVGQEWGGAIGLHLPEFAAEAKALI